MTTITLGGVARELRYPWKSIKRLRAECGINLLKPEIDGSDPETVTALLWGALIWQTPELTRDQVDEWITLRNLVSIGERCADALKAAIEEDPPPNG